VTRLRASALAGLLLACLVTAPAQADELRLSEAADGRFPERSYALTLPRAMWIGAEDVRVSENGRRVSGLSVATAAGAEARRFGVVLAIDTSFSMRGEPLKAALHAAREFVRRRNAAQPVAVVTFDGQVRVIQEFTTDAATIDNALSAVREGSGGSRMFDAAKRAAELIAAAKMPSASVVILSDGADRKSSSTLAQAAAAADAAHARIYTVGLRSRWSDHGILNLLAAETRAEFSAAGSLRDLARIYERLGSRLAHQYVVRYRSAQPAGHDVRVAVRVSGVEGVAAATYLSPSPPRAEEPPFRRSPVEGVWLSGAVAVVVALVIAVLLVLALWALLRPRTASLRARVAFYVGEEEASRPDEDARRARLLSGRMADETTRSLERARWWPGFLEKLDIAGIEVAPQKLIALVAAATMLALSLLILISGSPVIGLMAVAVPLFARMILERRVAKQRKLFTDQLPDNLQVMASAMRAGHSFSGALSVVVDDAPEPARRELARVVADERMGVPVDVALATVVQRMQSKDLEQVALVAALQRETGGNTAEVLERVTETIRERLGLRRLVQTLTAQGRMSRWVLTAIPLVLLLAISALNPDYVSPLYAETLGRLLLGMATVMVVVGSLIIGKIVNIKV
jgi:tight adherence protein B